MLLKLVHRVCPAASVVYGLVTASRSDFRVRFIDVSQIILSSVVMWKMSVFRIIICLL